MSLNKCGKKKREHNKNPLYFLLLMDQTERDWWGPVVNLGFVRESQNLAQGFIGCKGESQWLLCAPVQHLTKQVRFKQNRGVKQQRLDARKCCISCPSWGSLCTRLHQ